MPAPTTIQLGIQEIGYNGKVYFLFDSPTLAINWESVDPGILPKGSEERKWVDRKAAGIQALQKSCKEQNIPLFAQADLVLFPKRLVEKYGIETDGAGFKKILMKPELGEGITWAKGHYDSIRGRIGRDWKLEDSTFDWKIENPANTTATVFEVGSGNYEFNSRL